LLPGDVGLLQAALDDVEDHLAAAADSLSAARVRLRALTAAEAPAGGGTGLARKPGETSPAPGTG
jgi:hypothetical protein